ncbi:MAG: hypothetical protein HKN21_03710 [Candidatus Eisenbacteria bacterium]|uniref:Uncharacterized protein n=1 Tax=Eiseniibacteriota bacterium TaxID=2212470 RepID=A0A7Y2H1N6_UNCEI|nr:hypothetical protein [Candidatus Eisenbacteria bacterium]
MKNFSRTFFLAALLSGVFAFLGIAQETKLIEFEIKDQFHNEPKAANILVFDQRGELAHRTHGREVEPDILEAIVRSVQVLLDEW